MSDHVFHLTVKSSNKKVGPIPVSTTSQDTCPNACPLKNSSEGGCYAEQGPLKLHWDKVTNGTRGSTLAAFNEKIRALPAGQLWRHNQAGDLPGNAEDLDSLAVYALADANEGRQGFTYTHYDVESNKFNRKVVEIANKRGFTINLSSNSPAHADELADLECGPVVTLLPGDQVENSYTPKGRKVVVCPAAIKEGISCATCGMCARQNSGSKERPIVGFPVHGVSKKKAGKVMKDSEGKFLFA